MDFMIKYVARIAIIAGLLLTTGGAINTSSIDGCEENGNCEISEDKSESITVDKPYENVTVKDGITVEVSSGQGALEINSDVTNLTNNGTLQNIGTASNNSADGVYLNNSVSVTNLINNGTIYSATKSGIGMANYSYIGTLTNTINGTISGASGIYLNGANVGIIDNRGTITSSASTSSEGGIYISNSSSVETINNYGTITTNGSNAIHISSGSSVGTINNYNTIDGAIYNSGTLNTIYNCTTIDDCTGIITGGIYTNSSIEIYNYGTINLYSGSKVGDYYVNIRAQDSMTLSAYHLYITQDADTFNNFSGYTDSSDDDISHLTISTNTNSGKITLTNDFKLYIDVDVEKGFQTGKDYNLSNLIMIYDGSGNLLSDSEILTYLVTEDGSFTTTHDLYDYIYNAITFNSPILTLSEGSTEDTFQIGVDASSGYGNAIYKGNIQSMNNLLMQAHKTIFSPYKRDLKANNNIQESRISHSNARATNTIADVQLVSYSDAKTARSNKGLKSLGQNNSDYIVESNQEQDTTKDINVSIEQYNIANEDSNYYFFFTPFISYNNLDDSSGVGLSGMSYGFISGFNAKLGESNTLGLHLGFSYGSIDGDGKVNTTYTSANIDTLSLMIGLHYKLDLAYGMYIKAMGDFFYFLNDLDYIVSTSINNVEPNMLGYAISGYFGKDFDFDDYGKLGLEIGLNYQAIQSANVAMGLEDYDSSLIHLAYIDVGANYGKVFDSGLGLNALVGVKALLNEPKSKLYVSGNSYNFTIGTDKVIGYAGAGISYFVNRDIELDLSYLGLFGDKQMSNSGFVSVRLWW